MIGDMVLYAANRATQGAVGNMARRASWGGVAIFLLLVGVVFALSVLFRILTERYDAIVAGTAIASVSIVLGLVCLAMPRVLDWLESRAKKPADPVADTVASVKVEVAEAVDYFGPIRVVASAFMLGLGAARSLKR